MGVHQEDERDDSLARQDRTAHLSRESRRVQIDANWQKQDGLQALLTLNHKSRRCFGNASDGTDRNEKYRVALADGPGCPSY